MRTHVVKVETNIKVGGAAELSPLTLIVGRNRAGKSTLVNGLEAAGTGRVSDVAGRATLAKDADLAMLGGGDDSIFARAQLSDGQTCAWYLERGHRARRIGPEISFPLRAAREALLGEPDKARRWILQHGGAFDWEDVVQLTPEALRAKLRSIVWDATTAPDPAARLAQAIDDSKRRVRECNARAKAKPQSPGAPPPTAEEIRLAEEAVTAFASVGPLAAARGRLTAVEAETKAAAIQIRELEARETQIATELTTLPKAAPVSDVVRSALLVAEYMSASKARTCAICTGEIADPAALGKRVANARAKLDATIRQGEKRDQLEKALVVLRSSLTAARGDLARLEAEAEGLRSVIGSTTIPEGDPSAARARLSELHSRRAAWQAVNSAQTDAIQAERDAVEWGQLATTLSGALKQLVERARVGFEERVQAHLPDSWWFGVDLLDGEREVLRVGLRPGVYKEGLHRAGAPQPPVRAALSGAEWATVTTALALATAPMEGPVVIVPEERAFERSTLEEVLAAFASVAGSAQVIVTWPVVPEDLPADWAPEGWTIIRAGEAPPPIVAPTVGELAAMAKAERSNPDPALLAKIPPVGAPPPPPKAARGKRSAVRGPPKAPDSVDLDDLLKS